MYNSSSCFAPPYLRTWAARCPSIVNIPTITRLPLPPSSLKLIRNSSPELRQSVSPSNHSMFIFGLGYVGLSLARFLKEKGWDVSGTCRSDEKREAFESIGLRAFHFNSDNDGEGLAQDGMQALNKATHMITTIPPVADFDKDPVLSVYRAHLSSSAMNIGWIGYLSSTGVYGDYEGEWVDENSPPKATEKRAVARIEAEKAWLQVGSDSELRIQIFRLGGIYGSGRSAINTLLRSGNLSPKQNARQQRRKYTSRVHVADICRVIWASIQFPSAGRIYNVVDNEPAPREEVFSYARDLLREEYQMQTFLKETNPRVMPCPEKNGKFHIYPGKRVSNKRLKEELKVNLLYPSYKSGLKAVIESLDS